MAEGMIQKLSAIENSLHTVLQQILIQTTTASGSTTTRTSSSRVFSASSMLPSAATAYVAPQVFGEMPTPISVRETHGTPYNHYSGHHNISLNTCVLDRNGNLSEQNIDDMPQASGFHNLNCKSVVLEPMFAVYEDETDSSSSEFFDVSVDVCATIPEQQPYEDTQQGSGQSPKCFNMPIFSPETPTVGIDIDQLLNCPCEVSECRTWDEEYQGDDNSLWERSVCQTATRHYISLFPWDPGASLPLMLGKTQHSSQALQPATHATILTGSSASRFSGCTCLPFRVQYNMYVLCKSEISMTTYTSWDPGILHYMAPNGSNSVLQDNSFIMQRAAHLSEYGCFADQKLMANTSSKVAALTLLAAPLILLSSTTYIWDPGVVYIIDDITLDKYAVSHQVQCVQLKAEYLFLSWTACVPYVAPNGLNSLLHATCFIIRRASHLTQYNYLSSLYCKSVMKTSYVWDPGVEVSLHCWLVVLTAWSENDKPLSCIHIQGLAALQTQSVGNTASYVWNPGTMLPCYMSKWLVLFTEEKEMGRLIPEQWSLWFNTMHYCQIFQKCNALCCQQYSHQDIKLCGIPLWLINFQVP